MPRFFLAEPLLPDAASVRIAGEDARHIARSLRMATGEEIVACTPDGAEHRCRLRRIRDDEVEAEILETRPGEGESPIQITLYMAYPKGDKLETVVQKAVELGASVIVPFESERCIRRPKADKVAAQTERLSRIASEAAKQCGRSRLPEVRQPVTYREMLELGAAHDALLFCYEGEGTTPLPKVLAELPDVRALGVAVGSEGGFSPAEAELAQKAGARMCGLGKRILRCETAPLYVLSCLSYRYELSGD